MLAIEAIKQRIQPQRNIPLCQNCTNSKGVEVKFRPYNIYSGMGCGCGCNGVVVVVVVVAGSQCGQEKG